MRAIEHPATVVLPGLEVKKNRLDKSKPILRVYRQAIIWRQTYIYAFRNFKLVEKRIGSSPNSRPTFSPSISEEELSKRDIGSSVMVNALDLQSFILRARVLKLYRQALKIAHRAPPHSRGELKQSIREEMEKNRECKDKQKIRYLISEGLERIKQLDEMLDMQGH
ncbi:hypothetical protein HA466_0179090 [Hirschfeldia incana]|nr:hypothetical protein HA466_0179090 [Hirschfeldia incana]